MSAFAQCHTCGKYIASEGEPARGYCSRECANAYSICLNCGRYFRKGEGFDEEHCSKACTVQYEILRKYGPQPVTIVAEV
jgi:hypothetical protein